MLLMSIMVEALGLVTITVEAMEAMLSMVGQIQGLETGIVKKAAAVHIILQ